MVDEEIRLIRPIRLICFAKCVLAFLKQSGQRRRREHEPDRVLHEHADGAGGHRPQRSLPLPG